MSNELILAVHHNQCSAGGHCSQLRRRNQLFLDDMTAVLNLLLSATLSPLSEGFPAVGGKADGNANAGVDRFSLALSVDVNELRVTLKDQH